MHPYKEFIQSLRKLIYDDKAYILIGDLKVVTNLCNYVRLLTEVKFLDGSYDSFYGEVKNIVESFLMCFHQSVDDVIVDADKCSQIRAKSELLQLVEQSISNHYSDHVAFGRDFLPVRGAEQKAIYEEIDQKFKDYLEKYYQLRTSIEKMDKQIYIDDFSAEHFEVATKKTSEMFNFTHSFIAMWLADKLNEIRVSLEEIHLRMSNNLKKLESEKESLLNGLLQQLYDKNKEGLHVFRSEKKCSMESAEVSRGIQIIRDKISNFEINKPLTHLNEEVEYWTNRLKEFNEIEINLKKMKSAHELVVSQQQTYKSMRSADLPGSRYCCWLAMGDNFAKRRLYLEEKIIEIARCLITFFAVRGTDRIITGDHLGPHWVDEYKHLIYVTDHGLGKYHVDCKGTFKQTEEPVYLFDKWGRYIMKDGKKVYQIAPCTSLYKLTDNDLLEKVTEDCGHSERLNEDCKMEIKDPFGDEMLPDSIPLDIRGTLDAETANYLWDHFGTILSDALHDVGITKPKNPIHFLAHRLLYHKYIKTKPELRKAWRDAQKYRFNVYMERKEKAMQESREWKSKQVKRHKPKDYDDSMARAARDAIYGKMEFTEALDRYVNY